MIVTKTNFDTYNALADKKPVWIVEFDGISDKFCSQNFEDITSSYKKYVKDFFLEPIQIDLETLNHSFGGYRFKLIDKDSEITQIIIDNDIIDTKIDIKYGFQEIDRLDFIELPSAYIISWQIGDDLLSFDLVSKVLAKELDAPAFTEMNVTNLDGYMIPTDPDPINVDDASSFPATNGAIQIGDEYIFYQTKIGNAFHTLTRGYKGSEAAAHSDDDIVYLLADINEKAATFITRLLTNTDAGTNGFLDMGLPNFGSGIDESLIDINGMMNEDAKYNWTGGSDPYQQFSYLFTKEDESIHNIIEEILNGVPAILRFKNNNLLVQYYDYDIYDLYDDTLTDDEMKINSYKQGEIRNVIRSQIEKYRQGSFQNDQRISLEESITKYNKSRILSINSPQAKRQKVATSVENGDRLGQAIMHRYFMRFAQENFILDIDTHFNKVIWEVGDIIRVNSDKLPDFENGGRGIANKNFIIYEKSANLDGTLNFKLFGFREMMDRLSIADINRVYYANIDHPSSGSIEYNTDYVENNYQTNYDAKYDNPSSYEAHVIRLDFEISIYGYGSPGEENNYLLFRLMAQKPVNTNIIGDDFAFYYDNTFPKIFYQSYYIYNRNLQGVLSSDIFNRIRADWHSFSAGAQTDIEYIKLQRIIFIKFNTTLST